MGFHFFHHSVYYVSVGDTDCGIVMQRGSGDGTAAGGDEPGGDEGVL